MWLVMDSASITMSAVILAQVQPPSKCNQSLPLWFDGLQRPFPEMSPFILQ